MVPTFDLAGVFSLAATPGQGYLELLPFILIFVVFYMFMIRPGQKRQRQWQQMLGSLKSGDRVNTTGGIRGVVISVKDDVVQLRVAPDNLRIEVAKSAIATVTTDEGAKAAK